MENEKKKLEDVMNSLAELAGSAEKVADLEKRLSKAAENSTQMEKKIAALKTENEALCKDRARLRKERNESHALLNGIVLAIAKFKCRNPSIN